MAKCGNHGQVIPRDPELLNRLYWTENRSLSEVAAIFDVTHRSLGKVFDELKIPKRKRRAKGQSRWFKCIECGGATQKIKHAGNGSLYGRRCRECRRRHYNSLAREYIKRPEIKEKRDEYMSHWKMFGAINPTGELQWLNKGKLLLRSNRRLLLRPHSPGACALRSAVSALEQSSQT